MKNACQLQENCLRNDVVYKTGLSSVSSNQIDVVYIGTTGGTFNTRSSMHLRLFRNERYQKQTEFPKYIWNLTNRNKYYANKGEKLEFLQQ